MARRRPAPDPEVLALARERLIRVLGGGEEAPRRAARVVLEDAAYAGDDAYDEGGGGGAAAARVGGRDGRAVGLDDLAPPRRFTRWHLGIVAVVLLVGMVWGGWSWLQARPEAVAAPTVATASVPEATPSPSSAGSASSGSVESSGSATPAAGLVVHVLGAVRRPGLVRLPVGARVEDAIEGAGGLRADADPAELNLAQPLDDGVQVLVGTTKHPAGEVRSTGGAGGGSGAGTSGSTGSSGSSSAGTSATVDLNRASVDQLETLPGVGPVTAQKILDWRTQHGRFSRVEELQEVDGIGPKTYARMAPHARV